MSAESVFDAAKLFSNELCRYVQENSRLDNLASDFVNGNDVSGISDINRAAVKSAAKKLFEHTDYDEVKQKLTRTAESVFHPDERKQISATSAFGSLASIFRWFVHCYVSIDIHEEKNIASLKDIANSYEGLASIDFQRVAVSLELERNRVCKLDDGSKLVTRVRTGEATRKHDRDAKENDRTLTYDQEEEIYDGWLYQSTQNKTCDPADKLTRQEYAKTKGISFGQYKRVEDRVRKRRQP